MADDKLLLDPINMEAMGYGIFDSAQSVDQGRAALLDAYNSYDWQDDSKAKETLAYYGEQLKYKFKDQSEYSPDFLFQNAPVTLLDLNPQTDEDYDNLYDNWKKANLEYLDTNPEAKYAVGKEQLKKDITSAADKEGRKAGAAGLRESVGDTGAAIVDTNNRFLRGAASVVNPATRLVGVNLNDKITEITDPSYDQSFGSQLVEGIGQGAGLVATGGTLGATAVGASVVGQGLDSTVGAYNKSKQITGDKYIAGKAAAIEFTSQALQAGVKIPVFGRIAGKATGKVAGKLIGGAVEGAVEEGISEGAGQVISNIGENVGTGRSATDDVFRGAGRAAIIGGVVAGGLSATASKFSPEGNKVISEENSGARAQDIEEYGAPLTPVTKQTVGPVHVEEPSVEVEDTDSGLEEKLAPYREAEKRFQDKIEELNAKGPKAKVLPDGGAFYGAGVEDIQKQLDYVRSKINQITVDHVISNRESNIPSPKESVPDPSVPAFETDDGASYLINEEGQLHRRNPEGGIEQPFDHTVFINEETALKVSDALHSGGQLISGEGGVPTIENSDGTTEEIPYNMVYSEGTHPLEYSEERKPNKDTVVRPVRIGQKVRKVNIDRSLGAAGAAVQEQRESDYSQRLRASADIAPEMQAVGAEGIFYDTFSFRQYDPDIQQMIQGKGLQGVVQDLQNGAFADDPILSRRVGVAVSNAFDHEFKQAADAGDFDRLTELTKQFRSVAPLISQEGSSAGQALVAGRGKNLERLAKTSAFVDQAYSEAISEVAKEENVTPLDIAESDTAVKDVDTQIAQTQKELTNEAGEEGAIDNVIQEIHDEAAQKVEEDHAAIDEEAQGLETEIQSTENKARRTKAKDIQAIEEGLTSDQVELANAINTGKELSDVTAEERGKLEEDVNKQLESAESKANSLIKTAVAEERKNKEAEKLSAVERLDKRINAAKEALNKTKTAAKERLTKLKLKQKDAEKIGDKAGLADVEAKIKAIEDRVTNAASRVKEAEDAKTEHENTAAEREEADRASNELLDELEHGVDIRVSPIGNRRNISVRSKRSGLDITKLFKRGDAAGPLSALSRGVGELANVFSQGGKAKNKNNERIKALSDRIKENKKALDAVRQRDHLSDQQKKKIAAAKKRLETLAEAKKNNTVESRVNQKKLKKYQDRKAGINREKKTSRLSELESKLKSLQGKKEKVTGLQGAKERAKRKAAKKVQEFNANEAQIDKLEKLIVSENLKGATKNKVEQEITERKAVYEKDPATRDVLFKLWTANNIGSIFGTAVGAISSGVISPVTKSLGLISPTLEAIFKNIRSGSTKYKYPLLQYWSGLTDKTSFLRGLALAKGALTEGTRLENIIPNEDLVAERSTAINTNLQKKISAKKKELEGQGLSKKEIDDHPDIKALKNSGVRPYQSLIRDYLTYVQNLPPANGNPIKLISNTTQIFAGYTSGMLLRTLAAAEAITYGLHDSGFDRAAAAFYYNKGLDAGVSDIELQKYQYDPKENWSRAQNEAAHTAQTLKDAGVPMSAHDERILATEKYQAMRPREVQIDAFKQAAQVVLNAPAPGYAGTIVHHLNSLANDLSIHGAKPLRYLTPFANSIAQFMQLNMEVTPLGYITAISDKGANRTQFERHMAISSATVGTTLGAALAMYAISQIDDKDKWFDIVGKATQAERDAGVLSNSIKMGNTYIPFGETPFALLFGAVAGVVDKAKEGKDADMTVFGAVSAASFSALNSVLQNMNMLKGVSDIYEAVKSGAQGSISDAGVQVARTLIGTVKGFVPGAGIQRNISRYFERPIEARKDLTSAIVEGIPGVQSAFGRPSLNVLGEPMKSPAENGPLVAVHRIFSTKRDDIDIRWLGDNGYTVPSANTIRPTKATGNVKLSYEMKYDVMQRASSDIRHVVGQFRETYGSSAHRDEIQKALNKTIGSILAKYKVEVANDS